MANPIGSQGRGMTGATGKGGQAGNVGNLSGKEVQQLQQFLGSSFNIKDQKVVNEIANIISRTKTGRTA